MQAYPLPYRIAFSAEKSREKLSIKVETGQSAHLKLFIIALY
jgi:hypothetical protein